MLRKQLLDSSRGRLVMLLQHGGQTAGDLAQKLDVTTNAVREHLAAMERDGVVRRADRRPGTTRPSQIFELTPEVEQLLSEAYIPFLTQLVSVFADQLSKPQVDGLMRQVGAALADHLAPRKRPAHLRARVSLASRLINEHLGALTSVASNGSHIIRGVACPLAALTGKHPSVCLAMESFVAHVVGSPVHECCDRAERPRCCFEVRRL
jgi:DeoR family transcriptional regulator, suf operon transcriptional repressor